MLTLADLAHVTFEAHSTKLLLWKRNEDKEGQDTEKGKLKKNIFKVVGPVYARRYGHRQGDIRRLPADAPYKAATPRASSSELFYLLFISPH